MDAPIDTETVLATAADHDVSPVTLTEQCQRLQATAVDYLDLVIRVGFDPGSDQAVLAFTTDAVYVEGDELWTTFTEMADIDDPTALQAAHERALPTRQYDGTDAPLGIALPTAWQQASRALDAALMALIASDAPTAGALDYFFVRHRGWGKSAFANATGRSPQAVSNNVGTAADYLDDERWPTLDQSEYGE
jgi:hypothetical protein